MSKKVHVEMVDDIDGSTATGTIEFSLDGNHYEIDLSDSNAKKLRDTLEPWIGNARRQPHRGSSYRPRKPGGETTLDGIRLQDVRDWAATQNMNVSSRGRVAAHIIDAYRNQTGKKTRKADTPQFSG